MQQSLPGQSLNPTSSAYKEEGSPLTDHSDRCSPQTDLSLLSFDLDMRLHLYEPTHSESGVSERMSRRGVAWLGRVGWARGWGQACVWTAQLLYYAYRAHFPLGKEEMQAVILLCLQLSSKFHERRPLETRDLLLLATRPTSRHHLRDYEERLLRVTDFNLVIPHLLTLIDEMAEGEAAAKLHFLCELLAIKDHRIFFDGEKLRRLLMMVTGGEAEGPSEEEVEEIRELMADKESRFLQNKYSSQFDTDTFVSSFSP